MTDELKNFLDEHNVTYPIVSGGGYIITHNSVKCHVGVIEDRSVEMITIRPLSANDDAGAGVGQAIYKKFNKPQPMNAEVSEFAKKQACEFFKWEMCELKKLVEYNKKVGEEITIDELIRAVTTFQNSNTEARYISFLAYQSSKLSEQKHIK